MSHNFVKLLKLDSNSFLYGCLIHGSMNNSWRLEHPICRDSTLQPLQIHNLAVAAHIPRCGVRVRVVLTVIWADCAAEDNFHISVLWYCRIRRAIFGWFMMIVVSSRHLTRDIPQTFVISTLSQENYTNLMKKLTRKIFLIFSVKVYDNLLWLCSICLHKLMNCDCTMTFCCIALHCHVTQCTMTKILSNPISSWNVPF